MSRVRGRGGIREGITYETAFKKKREVEGGTHFFDHLLQERRVRKVKYWPQQQEELIPHSGEVV